MDSKVNTLTAPKEKPNGHYVLKTLGCKANFYDSQILEAEFRKRGWLPLSHKPRQNAEGKTIDTPVICVVNSCTVTDEADRQSRKMAARLSRDNPNAHVVMTGCASEVDPERLTQSKGIHYVIGNRDKLVLVDLMLARIQAQSDNQSQTPRQQSGMILGSAAGYTQLLSHHPMDREWPAEGIFRATDAAVLNDGPQAEVDKTRAFLKIQEGCNSFCTYCIIPYGRGPSRSLRPREVIEQVRALVSQGVKEVVITGTNIGDYGSDWSSDGFDNTVSINDEPVKLFEMIFSETSLERLRVSSLDPTEITERMLRLMAQEPRFCPHFHVSLQSPHSRILKLMKRRYGFEHVKSCLEKISAIPRDVFVGMDIITGFPGETLEEFEWGVKALSELPWTRLHVFPYSEREGTPATRLKGSVPQSERARRAKVLFELSFERMKSKHQVMLRSSGLVRGVLLERAGAAPRGMTLGGLTVEGAQQNLRWQAGYSANYLRVYVPEQIGARNRLVDVKVQDIALDPQNGDVAFVAGFNT